MNTAPSASPPPGRPKDMEKRAAILEAAMALFPSRGYDGVSVDAIAQMAGVSKLTVYSHFDDKEALFGAAVTECCVQLLPHRLFEPDPEQPVSEVLFQIARAFIDLMFDERAISLHRVMIGQAGQNRRLTEIFFSAGPRTALMEMESFLRLANAAGRLRIADPVRASEHFFCLLKGLRHMRVLVGLCDVPTSAERDEHVRDVVQVFLRAFAPEAL
jgi:TetR/AcrR family transcriptional regulator, mexJK operon transcriptional repressor